MAMAAAAVQAITDSLRLWHWLAATGATSKHKWPDWAAEGARRLKGYGGRSCYLCDYVIRFGLVCKSGCPVRWTDTGTNHCCVQSSPFMRWFLAPDRKSRQQAAASVVQLLEKALAEVGVSKEVQP